MLVVGSRCCDFVGFLVINWKGEWQCSLAKEILWGENNHGKREKSCCQWNIMVVEEWVSLTGKLSQDIIIKTAHLNSTTRSSLELMGRAAIDCLGYKALFGTVCGCNKKVVLGLVGWFVFVEVIESMLPTPQFQPFCHFVVDWNWVQHGVMKGIRDWEGTGEEIVLGRGRAKGDSGQPLMTGLSLYASNGKPPKLISSQKDGLKTYLTAPPRSFRSVSQTLNARPMLNQYHLTWSTTKPF